MRAARTLGFELAGAGVAVQAEQADVLAWLTEVLQPGFGCGPAAAGDRRVVLHAGSRPAVDGAALGPVGVFALDRGVVLHDAYAVDGERTEVVDTRLGARYEFGPGQVDVYPDGPSPRPRMAALRVVHEVATVGALADGHRVQLHASAFAGGGGVVLLAGPKEAGKTTVLAHLCSTTGAPLVANDRVLLTPAWTATPITTIVSVRPATMALLPHLFTDIPDVERPAHLTLAEADRAAAEHGTVREPRRLKLSPAQLARALGVPLSTGGAVAAVAFVRVDEEVPTFAVRALAPAAARPLLTGVRYGARSTAPGGLTIFERWAGSPRPTGADDAALDGLAADVPCHEVRVGPGFLRSATAPIDLAAALSSGA